MRLSNRQVLFALPVIALIVSACGQAATPTTAPTTVATSAPAATAVPSDTAAPAAGDAANLDTLVAAAQKGGQLNVMALPRDWANYGEMIDTFKQKYNLKVNEIKPDASSGEEVEAVKANKDNKGPQAPDVIDVGFAFGPDATSQGLVQPYKVATWDTIPDNLKEKDGNWYGDYYGVLSFEVNTAVIKNVPQDWSDLLKPEYKGQIALAGDPRSSNQAIFAVWAAALANGGSLDNAQPGLDFFKKLKDSGNLVPVIAKPATVAKGETPIALRWDYNALSNRDQTNGNPQIDVVVPQNGIIAGVYVQAISKYAPNTDAAKLWMEYLYSDAGQLTWLKGYAHPVRFNDMVKRNVVPAELSAKLPPAELYAKAAFPTLDQIEKAQKVITEGWDTVVGLDVK